MKAEDPKGNALVRFVVSFAWGICISSCALFLLYAVYRQPADLFGGELRFGDFLSATARAWFWALVLNGVGVLVHESGHAVAALRCGMTITSIRLWPIDWRRRRRGMRPHRAASAKPAAVVYAVPNADRSIWLQRAWFAAGGPVANLAAAAIGVAAWLAGHETRPGLAAFAAVFAFLNVTMAIMNLLPIGRDFASDGTKLRKALRREEDAETDIDLLRYTQASYTRTHWPEVPEPVLERWMNARRPSRSSANASKWQHAGVARRSRILFRKAAEPVTRMPTF